MNESIGYLGLTDSANSCRPLWCTVCPKMKGKY